MTTVDFITELFCRIGDAMKGVCKHPQALLYPSEIVTLGVLFALKGVGNRQFYRWLKRDYLPLFPCLPDRTRLFRLFTTHQDWTNCFLVEPSQLSVIDCYVHDTTFHPLIRRFEDRTVVFSDFGFHTKQGDPTNLKVCEPFHHNERMIVETFLSMLTTICHFKKVMHRLWESFQARLAFMMVTFNLLVGWFRILPASFSYPLPTTLACDVPAN
jgi:hypothetical protein